MIANCGHDERNEYSGGVAGDQTGREWAIVNWYPRPWNFVLRHPDASVRKEIAELATEAANNDFIGYDQSERLTFWNKLKSAGYHPANIDSPCEADCSSGVAAIVKAVGYLLGITELKKVSIYSYTGNLREALKNAGFEVLSDADHTGSEDYLLAGDILLYEYHHTAINLNNGSLAEPVTNASNLSAISGMPSLVKGSKCYEVKTLQRLLNSMGYTCGSVDGVFGVKTEIAVKNFQSDSKIEVSYPGTVGLKTWSKLLKNV